MVDQKELQVISLKNNTSIAYIDRGNKKKHTLLFIHGLANYLWVWKWNIASLQENYRCIAIDLPGSGFSSRTDAPYSIQYFSEIIEEFVLALNLKNVCLVGHSMGGQIALRIALRKQIAVSKLILCAPAGLEYYTPHEANLFKSAIAFGNFLAMDETHIMQSINSSFYNASKIAADIISDLNTIIQHNDRIHYRKMLEKCIDSMLDDQVFQELKNILQPTLIFFGENDQLIPNRFLHPVTSKKIAEIGTQQMGNARHICYPETGHFVQIEKAAQVNNAIAAFIN